MDDCLKEQADVEEELEEEYMIAFQLVAVAGDSKAESMAAINAAEEFKFDEAEAHLKAADAKMNEAHNIQTGMLQKEASGEKVKVNIILVHAQDHLTSAMIMRDQADTMVRLYRTIEKLSK